MVAWPLAETTSMAMDVGAYSKTGSAGVTVTAGTANTKGTWTQLTPGTARIYAGFYLISLTYNAATAADRSMLVDIGVGAAGSEVVLVANLLFGKMATGIWYCPITVPGQTRIALRTQCTTASQTSQWEIVGIPSNHFTGPDVGTVSTTYGADTVTSSGTTLATPGGAGSAGAWTQLTAATTQPTRFVQFCMAGAKSSTVDPSTSFLFDLGYGSSGNEQTLIAQIPGRSTTSEEWWGNALTLPVAIPEGERVVARLQGSSITTPMPVCALVTYA